MTPAKQQELMEKYFKLNSDIKQDIAAVHKAEADAISPEIILSMRTDVGKKLELFRRLTVFLGQKKLPPSAGTVLAPSIQPPPPGVAVPAPTTTPATESNPPAPEPTKPPLPSAAADEQQNLNVPNLTLPAKISHPTEAVAQAHRLMQQQNQQPLAQQGDLSQISRSSPPSPACRRHHTTTSGK